ncbi:MAG TPA: myxosortase-dependent M36 family metallopeptidase [Archangium sp.]|uniref:myxosortase-dependent M36 family metallopeptidase n=1 Tax=Archangium sp. TaxID=1872627 RepID=UPI002E3299AF|nr:myxosortase-dependent M36 family metallopeptidase [Archangium sp.]HEX5754113.1 myxosortase-dependent M36 family metallopeptidase [Archangium sp.]
MKRLLYSLTGLVLALGGTRVGARDLPPIDAFAQSPARSPGARPRTSVQGGEVAHEEPRLGVPTFVWAERPRGAGALRALSPEQAARAHLAGRSGFRSEAHLPAAGAPLRRVDRLAGGGSIVTFAQEVEGTELFGDSLQVLLDANNDLVAVTGYLTPDAARGPRLHFRLSPQEAVGQALADLTGEPLHAGMLVDSGRVSGAFHHFDFAPALRMREQRLSRPARVKPVAFPLPEALVPAWYVEVFAGPDASTEAEAFAYVLAAGDGRILLRQSLTWQDAYSYRVWADETSPHLPHDGPQGHGGTPHPTGLPDGYQPPFVAPNLITLANSPFSRNDPWLPAGATTLTGNNVLAYADVVSPDGLSAGDVSAAPTGPNTFDFVYDVSLPPDASATQRMASITQLFFVNNFFHDWFYDAGFDEAAGNGQTDNFGRGGLGNDALLAEAQDFSGTDNANIEVPADGASPRMQMYVFSPKGLKKLTAHAPASLARDYTAGFATFGPRNHRLTGDLVLVDDLASSTLRTDACETPFANAAQVAGKIALIEDGNCLSDRKVRNAQANGAVGAIIMNRFSDSAPGWISGSDAASVTIPAVSIGKTDGTSFKTALAGGQTVTVTLLREELVRRDGTLDNTIVAHEWAHYLSARLVGNGVGLRNQQGGGLGEGWSDFAALLMLVREEDALVPSNAGFGGTYATGSHAFGGGSNNGFYFGVRRYPYSTDFSKNPLTFQHIQKGVALPEGIPIFPAGPDNFEVHNVGEVWAQMLWECYAALLRDTGRLTFAEAQQRMKEYLVASLKLTPSSPTILEARDALLAAARARDDRDYRLFLRAFARRGAGAGAVGPARDSGDLVGVTESYESGESPTFIAVTLDDGVVSCNGDGILDNGETGRMRVTLKNQGVTEFRDTRVTVTTSSPGVTLGSGGVITFPVLAPGASATGELNVTLEGPLAVQRLSFVLTYGDFGPDSVGTRSRSFEHQAHYTFADGSSSTETVEAPNVLAGTWATSRRTTYPFTYNAQLWSRAEEGQTLHFFRLPDAPALSDIYLVSPPLAVSSTQDFGFTFRHRYGFDFKDANSYDGGVIEISTDGGTSWTDIGTSITPGYDTTLYTSSLTDNPLKGKKAFARRSAGYPAWINATVNLGKTYAGKTVRIRFRVGTDESNGTSGNPPGWNVDDLAFTGLTNTPFSATVAKGVVCNRPPLASAGADQVVDERQPVRLEGSGTDPDPGTTLHFSWKQLSGPSAVLTDSGTATPSFTAPEVTKDEVLTFELTVSDGALSSSDTVEVKVLQKNRTPVLTPLPGMDVDEGSPVTLSVSAVDPDGDEVSYAWTKKSGPDVVLSGVETGTLSFTAPEVPADATLLFEVVATDGLDASAPLEVNVGVRQVNKPPVARAGEDHTVTAGGTVSLEASASSDPDGDSLRFAWSQVHGPAVELLEATSDRISFTAPAILEPATLTFRVRVTDPGALFAEDEVSVTVNPAPVPDAGTDGPDAGTGGPDAGSGETPPDAGTGPGGGQVDAGGCGCSSGSSSGTASLLPMMLFALGLVSRRRRV